MNRFLANRYLATLQLLIYTGLPVLLTLVVVLLMATTSIVPVVIVGIASAITTALLLGFRLEREANRSIGHFNAIQDGLEQGNYPAFPDKTDSNLMPGQEESVRQLSMAVAERIAALLKSNNELSRRYSQFQSILATMSEGVLLIGPDGRILYCNQFAGQLLGKEPVEIEKRQLWEVVRTPGLEQAIEKSLASGQALREEFEIQRTKHIVEMSAVQLDVDAGAGLVIVLHDYTELRRLEKLRREFVSNVSHELKTPLTSIQVYTETLLEGGLEDVENSRSFVERIQEQSERLQQLIQDMLRLARIEAQSEAFQLERVSLSDMVSNSVRARQAIANAREIDLSYHNSMTGSIDIVADGEGIRTIFENLINNALNYTPPQGAVEVHCWQENNWAVVEIRDNGIGIPEEHHTRIFERFYRVDKARSRGMGGTGLGLSIVKHCVNLFDGEIELESSVGQGTTFRVRFPLVKSESPEVARSA